MSTVRPVALTSLAGFAALLASSPAFAQEPGSMKTRDFVQSAAQSDQFEILEAQTVLAGSQNPDVRAFAQQMIQDHQRLSQDLKNAAMRSGLKPPGMGIGGDQAQFLSALQGLQGAEFDKAYVKQQALAHRAALAEHQTYAASGDDRDVRQAAASAIPVVQAHTAMIDQIAVKLGAN